ncbi:uncharacterized protein PHACADRAFT_168719 [Phanerochaete carnosa HHB-10118-sp]|uniref:Uncharacterized protein n=1 Tax=Phanerochaete carnosa (strain HHB-10118-sp) TaxID=650164 RepID=K5WPC4_PHACS|nr:uncharacterized protein PHACADRAFT_168719 [Phanerochaete carnosa HHB-10118-sp]EKM61285.1 hypothetical protein PHACADRAFT_168719 [Phanerochaete carnosa HHB-10118-sp]
MRPVDHLLRHRSAVDRRKAKVAKRPEAQRWSSAPATMQSGMFLDAPGAMTAQVYKVRCVKLSRDYLMHVRE